MENNEIVLFESKDKKVVLSVPMDGDTVWLTQDQMAELFDTARSTITYHVSNVFKEGEVDKNTSVEIFDGSTNKASPIVIAERWSIIWRILSNPMYLE